METMMMSDNPHMTDDLLQELDSINVNITRQLTLQLLALSEEATLIIEAAKALVEMNNVNSSYPPVRQFYLLGLQLEKMRGQLLDGASTARKRSITTKNSYCTAAEGYCARCPFPLGDNDCFGMCGRGCDCWSRLCGDCCVHQYCLTHDACCARRVVVIPMIADNVNQSTINVCNFKVMSSVGRDTLLSTNPKYAVGIYRFYWNTCPQCSIGVTHCYMFMLLKPILTNDKPHSEPTEETGVEGAVMIAEMLEEFSGDLYYGSENAGFRFQMAVNSTYYILRISSIGTGIGYH
uniref:Uncharacterized protein n=1 Tax=Amphimedon queenslandica TaxID=400682 RepID=A0A1X7TXK5_AMPQE